VNATFEKALMKGLIFIKATLALGLQSEAKATLLKSIAHPNASFLLPRQASGFTKALFCSVEQ